MSSKEIRVKITSIKKTQKITDAMQKVAASKMRKAQVQMQTSMPYATKIRDVIYHIASSHAEYRHHYLQGRADIKRVGYIVVGTDRGLCGGLNINLFKLAMEHARHYQTRGIGADWCLFGKKAEIFFRGIKANILAQETCLGEKPAMANLLGGIRVMLDAYHQKNIDRLFIVHNEFLNTIVQRPNIEQLLPITALDTLGHNGHWDYIYEPDPRLLLDKLMQRYVEMQVYQAVVDNLACEQVARMLAMKSATDNAAGLIGNLQLAYNKARQAAITQEISEIIGGANAV